MVVDTGAEGSSVTPETTAELGLPRDPTRQTLVKTVGGQDIVRNAVLEQLGVADITYSHLSVVVLALDGAETGSRRAGLIGADLLRDFDIELDIPRRVLTLYRIGECKMSRPPWDGQYQTVSARVSERRQFLFPVELNGHSLTALFDTGSRGETVSHGAAESVGVSDAQLDTEVPRTGTSGGLHGYGIRRHQFEALNIGAETFRNIPLDVVDFHQPGVDILVGADYMHGRRFFLSYSTGTLFIQTEPRGSIRPNTPSSSQENPAPDRCRPPPDLLRSLAHDRLLAVSRPRIGLPETVQANHIDGCVAVMFHLAADGTPIDIKLVTENPIGYGLGDFVIREITATKFQPHPEESNWYYEVRRFYPSQAR